MEGKNIAYANLNLVFGSEESPLLEYLDEIVMPALQGEYIRQSTEKTYYMFDNVNLTKFKDGDLAIKKADIQLIIEGRLKEIQIQRAKIIEYINSIEDSLIRQIVFYRNVSCMNWRQVAMEIGGDNTEDSIRKSYDRFLEKNKVVRFVRSICDNM